MRHATYEKQLIKAYNATELYHVMSWQLAIGLVDSYKHYKRGVTIKQVLDVLKSELVKPSCTFDTIQLALNETTPKGVRHDA